MQKEKKGKKALLISLIAAIGLAACGGSNAGGNPVESDNAGSSQLTLDEAQQVAETFLQGWQNSDYAAMYGLISPNARDGYSEAEFTETYTETATTMTLSSLESQVKNSLRQGTTAAILYDISFHTNLFGDIADLDRTMRLIETPEGWRVAWSPMDIFAELVEGARLNLQRTMPGRGNIYDRNGNVMVDQNGRAVTLNLVKQDVPDMVGCITLLSNLFVREYKDIEEFIAPYNMDTRFPVGELDPETYDAEAGNLVQLCSIGNDDFDTSTRTTRRYYGDLAPHVLGYVSQITPEQMTEYAAKGYP
ncbi:MAG TPA: NTF2-like N-terminal transpeptidase domain-containing protein, partial [Aggregatilineaceae bacterium]|nr:NTF2-like N-terminal transpeptidase domain-containing protein [Aggregatilineaceae bacterium]